MEFDYADVELQALAATDWRADYRLAFERLLCAEFRFYHEPMQPEIVSLSALYACLLARNASQPMAMAITSRSLSCARYGGLISGGKMMDAAQRQQVRHFCWRPCWRESITSAVSPPLTSLDTFHVLGGVAPFIRSLWESVVATGYAVVARVAVRRAFNLSGRG